MNDIFNSIFEESLRILIILNTDKSGASVERLTAFDYIAVYGKDFGISNYNLHGDNDYRFSEYSAKRKIVTQAIKELVLKGDVVPHSTKYGFHYTISKSGIGICDSLNDLYAKEFESLVKITVKKFHEYSDIKLIHCINEYAIKDLEGQ